MRVVLDTNVLVAGTRSPRGASASVLKAARAEMVQIIVSPTLFLEYEAVLTRPQHLKSAGLGQNEILVILDTIAGLLSPAAPMASLRPLVSDPDDDMVLETAIFGVADAICTFEVGTFGKAAGRFGIDVLTPREVCRRIGI